MNVSNIKDLNLFRNRIFQIPEAIKAVHSLNTIDLGGNLIEELAENSLASLPNLSGLKLDDNNIETIDKSAFARLGHLQILNLGGNKISEIERQGWIFCWKYYVTSPVIGQYRGHLEEWTNQRPGYIIFGKIGKKNWHFGQKIAEK